MRLKTILPPPDSVPEYRLRAGDFAAPHRNLGGAATSSPEHLAPGFS